MCVCSFLSLFCYLFYSHISLFYRIFVDISHLFSPTIIFKDKIYHLLSLYAVCSHCHKSLFIIFQLFRKLHPCSQLGVAELELEFQDGSSRTFMASVVQVP